MKNTYTAIITARGGSKGLPKKNILDLVGKPLIAHTIDAALESKCFQQVVVSTDCPEIKSVSFNWNAKVIDRPAELATDMASSLDVINHTIMELKRERLLTSHFVLLQPTSPLRNAKHIQEAVTKFEESGATSLVSVTEAEHPIQKFFFENDGILEPVFTWEDLTQPRQLLRTSYLINGAIYITDCRQFLKSKNLFLSPVISYFMDQDVSIDIDRKEDFYRVETWLNSREVHFDFN